MVGKYHQSNSWSQKARIWALKTLKTLTARQSVSIHIDELLSLDRSTLSEQDLLNISCIVYKVVLERVVKSGELDRINPVLVIALKEHEHDGISNLGDIPVDEQLSSSPPEIHLICRDFSQVNQEREEYRISLPSNIIPALSETGVSLYFSCFRNSVGIHNNWEFARSVVVEYYPEQLKGGDCSIKDMAENIEVFPFPQSIKLLPDIHKLTVNFLVESGLPCWCAPHLYFGDFDDVYLPRLKDWSWGKDWESSYSIAATNYPDALVLGSAQDGEAIVLLPNKQEVFVFNYSGTKLLKLNSTIEGLRQSITSFEKLVERTISLERDTLISTSVSSRYINEFHNELRNIEPSETVWLLWAERLGTS